MFADWQGDLLIGSPEFWGHRAAGTRRGPGDRRRAAPPEEGRIRDVAVDAEGAILALVDDEDGRLLRLTPR